MRKLRVLLAAAIVGLTVLATPSMAVAAVEDVVTGTFYPLAPARLMDTREGLGAPRAKIGAGATVELQVAGRGGVPAGGIGAVVLNVTVTGPTAESFITLYPSGEARPTASSVNFPASWLGSNNVTVKLGTGGKVAVYNRNGSTDVVVDVVGFYAGDNTLASSHGMGAQYHWFVPERFLDTRSDGTGMFSAGSWRDYSVDFGYDNGNIRALVLNFTVVSPAGAGFVTAWSGQGERPISSTVNYGAGKTVPNVAFVQTTPCTALGDDKWCVVGAPTFRVYASQSTHLLIDVVGAMADVAMPEGLRFQPASPTRIADSRTAFGFSGSLGPGVTSGIATPAALVTESTAALALNVTAVTPTNSTVITVWPSGYDSIGKPSSSNLNPSAAQTVSGAVLGPVGPAGGINVHNLLGTTHMVVDVVGSFYYP